MDIKFYRNIAGGTCRLKKSVAAGVARYKAFLMRKNGSAEISKRKFGANQNGATAVEFALVAAPFLAILFGLLELALIFVVNVSLDSATAAFAAQIRTGQVLAPGSSASSSSGVQLDLADAKSAICKQMPLLTLSICTQQLQLDVRPLSSFQNPNSTTPISGSSFDSSNLCYYSGNAGDVVAINAYYLFSIVNPLLLAAFSTVQSYTSSGNTSSGAFFPITTTQVFKSENFQGSPNTGAGC